MSSWKIVRRNDRLEIRGRLQIADGTKIWAKLRALSGPPAPPRLDLDLRDVEAVDSTILSLLVEWRAALHLREIACEIIGTPPPFEPLLDLYGVDRACAPTARPQHVAHRAIARIGGAALRVISELRATIAFAAGVIGALVADTRRANWRALPPLLARDGADGITIVVTANFLIGFVMAYQTQAPLKAYGANLYVADVVGTSVLRELSPLMTAIIIIGRSGAAYAAELGAMRVTYEIDALRVLGLQTTSYLVVPRVMCLAMVAPALTLLGDIAGLAGGLVVATSNLGLTSRGYLNELRASVVNADVWTGLVKSAAFGVVIAFVATRRGLATRGSPTHVGRSTTATVVASTFAVIVVDTILTMVFNAFHV